MALISDIVNPFRSRSHNRGTRPRHRRLRAPFERLESRLALANTAPSNFPIELSQVGTELYILYSQPDASGFTQTADQHVVVDIDEFFTGIGTVTQRVNVYASTNPQANLPGIPGTVFLGITAIHVTVPNYDDPGVNNNSLTLKGINGPTDRIIVSGSGRTAAGRWSDEAAPQLQIVFDVAGIDDLTVTAGGVINVSGAFTNDTGDASIHAVGEIAERQADQMTSTIIVGETTPTPGSLPQSRLVSNYIEIIGAEIDIYSDIEATGQVILRQPATTPQTARANLILPYDITVTDPDGVLELHSTRNIVQLQSSTLVANKAVAISNVGDINVVDGENSIGPWLIDLGSVNNDFNTISLGMVSNAIDTPSQDQSVDARGRIGVRDIDDLTVADFGILATTGIVTLRSVGPLTIDAAVQATGLLLQSDTSVATTPRAVVSVNSPTPDTGSAEPVAYVDLGVTIDVSTAAADDVTGNVTLDGRIVMDLNNVREDEDLTNKTGYGGVTIHAAGVTNLNSQILTLGDIRVHARRGINVAGQLQAGGTFISKNGSVVELVAADLSLTTATGDITVSSPTANLPLPTTLSATNLLAMDAGGDISIGGSLFAGSIYNNTADLPTDNDTLPSITIRAVGDVDMAQTAVLKTRAYGTNYNASPNPQIGLITVSDVNAITSAATIDADGGFTISARGDITVSGATVAREAIYLRTQSGDIDVQGSLTSKGAAYTVDAAATPPFVVPAAWTPSVTLEAPNGAIATSDTGVLTAGASSIDGIPAPGQVVLTAQQTIGVGADIISAKAVLITSKLGGVQLDAGVKAGADGTVVVVTAAGVALGEFGSIAGGVSVTNTNVLDPTAATDIDLRATGNAITSFTARNQSPGGAVRVSTTGALSIAGVTADGDIAIVAASTLTLSNALKTTDSVGGGGDITLESLTGGMNVNTSVEAAGVLSISAAGEVTQRGGNIVSILLTSGGRNYTYADPLVDPPDGVGEKALASAEITPYPNQAVKGYVSNVTLLDSGWGYFSGQRVKINFDGDGSGASAYGIASIVTSSIIGGKGISLNAGDKVTLVNTVRAASGAISVTSERGDVAVKDALATAGAVLVRADRGKITAQMVKAGEEVVLEAHSGVTVSESVASVGPTGDVSIRTTYGVVDFPGGALGVSCAFGNISITSVNGTIMTPPVMNAGGDISVTSFGDLTLNNAITSTAGDVIATSTSGLVVLNSDVRALAAGTIISVSSAGDIVSQGAGGVTSVKIITPGSNYSAQTFVTFAPPVNPPVGVTPYPAYGRPVIVNGQITAIEIVSPGVGYQPGEQVAITITDPGTPSGDGATAIGLVSLPKQSLYADGGVSLTAQGKAQLTGSIQTVNGPIMVDVREGLQLQNSLNAGGVLGSVNITTLNRDLDFTDTNAIIGCPLGDVSLVSVNGGVLSPPVLNVGGTVIITAFSPLTIGNGLTAANGVVLESTSGALAVNAAVLTSGQVTLTARTGITQQAAIRGESLIVTNTTNTAVTLTNSGNNIEQFVAASPGAVSYTDADDFETGVQRPVSPAPLPIEVVADSLTLASIGINSTIRVVSGLRYKTLNIQAGTAGGSAVGVVEYVTTSSTDNPTVGSTFAGTLRDMIRYANDNTAVYSASGGVRPQPQAMVFDEENYDVQTIAVGPVALPAFTKPVTFNGGRLTDAVLAIDPTARLGIVGSATAASGLRFDSGSNASSISTLAVGGFTKGSGLLLTSAGSTVTNVWAGIDRDGSTALPNQVGVEVAGTGAIGNVIGSVVVDAATQNQISFNTIAGLLVRGGASGTRVFGNQITLNGNPTAKTGDGIRINGATNTLIGTPDAMQPDLLASTSNTIGLNGGNGILIVNANAGSDVTANRIRNNYVVANGAAGIAVNGSQFVVIGGTAGTAGNTVIDQLGAGVSIANSANVRLLGNDIGLDEATGVAVPSGNGGNGVIVSASRAVGITSGNRIVDNTLNGVAIVNASTGVSVSGNTVGQAGAGNGLDGIAINASIGNTVGAGNVVSFNGGSGASITNAVGTSLTAGNRIFGSLFSSNTASGVSVSGGAFSWIGGTKAGEANLIQSNGGSGVTLQWNGATGSPTGIAIEGNRIGTNANREVTALGNGVAGIRLVGATNTVVAVGNAVMNNATAGVVIEGGTGNVVGGVVAGRGNSIGANTGSGVVVSPATLAGLPTTLRTARNVTIAGNAITANSGNGVQVTGAVGAPTVAGVTIGQKVTGTGASGLGNFIQANAGFGVSVVAGAQQVSFQGNSIADNTLGGVSVAAGANRSTAQSLGLASAILRGTGATQSVTISGSLSNATFKQQQYSIDFYANAPEDGNYAGLTGYQARRLIGRATVVADASGNASFSLRITAPLTVGEVITATATALRFEAGSTSILSNAITADLPGIATPRF